MRHIVSFSGGRTSAYLVYLMEQKRINDGWDVEYIFMDTSAEHPKTYEFVKNVRDFFDINLVCLKYIANQEKGKGGTYDIVSIESCKHDLSVWDGMVDKYGMPFLHGAFCSDRMKNTTFNKYIKDNIDGEYVTWLGIRHDEPKRIFGQSIDSKLTKRGFDSYDKSKLYADTLAISDVELLQAIIDIVSPIDNKDPFCKIIFDRLISVRKNKIIFMAGISDFDKDDILNWWSGQSFNLEIPEHLGNCVFCIKKGINKVALAAKDEPQLAEQFSKFIASKKGTMSFDERSSTMYRDKNSFDDVIAKFSLVPTEDLRNSILKGKKNDSGSCSESCEVLANQMSLL